MIAWLIALILAISAPVPAEAWLQSRDSNYNKSISAGASYTGPGDIVASATAWYGLRGYNGAYATGSNKSINVRRASDNTTQDINILSTGALDITTANTFAGTDATASCTIATTTATCTGASSTPHVGSTITGSGVTNPCFATAVGTFIGGAGTVTLGGVGTSPCGTIAVAATMTFQYGLYVTEAYDQSGNAHPITQGTAANQPELLPLCINSLPCMNLLTRGAIQLAGTITSVNQPYSLASVMERTGSFSSNSGYITTSNGAIFSTTSANTLAVYCGASTPSITANDSVWHSASGVCSGLNSVIYADAVTTTGSSGVSASGTAIGIAIGTNPFAGNITEAGMWPLALSPTQQTNLCKNDQAYYNASNFGATC